jgi:hypothetical protein
LLAAGKFLDFVLQRLLPRLVLLGQACYLVAQRVQVLLRDEKSPVQSCPSFTWSWLQVASQVWIQILRNLTFSDPHQDPLRTKSNFQPFFSSKMNITYVMRREDFQRRKKLTLIWLLSMNLVIQNVSKNLILDWNTLWSSTLDCNLGQDAYIWTWAKLNFAFHTLTMAFLKESRWHKMFIKSRFGSRDPLLGILARILEDPSCFLELVKHALLCDPLLFLHFWYVHIRQLYLWENPAFLFKHFNIFILHYSHHHRPSLAFLTFVVALYPVLNCFLFIS